MFGSVFSAGWCAATAAGVCTMRAFASAAVSGRGRIRVMKPTSPGMRGTVRLDTSHLYRGRPVKSLSFGLRSKGGRNNQGRITVRHRGGGHKRRYRIIDFRRSVLDREGVVERLEYDPNRSAYIALINYTPHLPVKPSKVATTTFVSSEKRKLAYILAPEGVKGGDRVIASRTKALELRAGNAMPLRFIPLGSRVHNVELYPRRGGQMTRSAGLSCEVLEKDDESGYATLRLPSKEERRFLLDCLATIGSVCNAEHSFRKLGKAGASRHRGRRPKVRGVAMNPVDHPHGGGEGKASGGRPSVSPWGKLTKGKKTRSPRRNSRLIVRRRDGRLVRHK